MTPPRLPYYKADEALRARVTASLRAAPREAPLAPRRWARAVAGIAAALVLVGGGWLLGGRGSHAETWYSDVLSAHLRALAPGHLVDVASTDQHTVKPWFAGKVPFSPIVTDEAAQGFPLVGGRVDFLAGQPAAALVYTRRAHQVNVFEQPDSAAHADSETAIRGYHILAWSSGGMRFWAVSDLNVAELRQLRDLLRSP